MRLRIFVLICMWLLCGQQAFSLRPSVIYGPDNRADYFEVTDAGLKAAADATVALIRTEALKNNGSETKINTVNYGQTLGLCPGEPYYDQDTASSCSGFLVTPDLVVTAGHCVPNQQACDNLKFVFGFRVETAGVSPHSVKTEHVFGCQKLVHSEVEVNSSDFAVIRLDRPVTHVAPLAFRTSGEIGLGDSLVVMGHPSGSPLKIAGGGAVRTVQPDFLVANLDTYGGNSGSAVFNYATGEVEGVLVRGEMDWAYVNGCRVSKKCADNACRGEDVTKFERVLPFLN